MIGLDGDWLQDAAHACGLIEDRQVIEPCGKACACDGIVDFPTTCFFVTDAGNAAMAASKKASLSQPKEPQ